MTDDTIRLARKIAGEIIEKNFFEFFGDKRRAPQLIRISKEMWEIMVPEDRRREPAVWHKVPVIKDDDLKPEECVCQWKN